jgi:hypothetical protein
LKYLLFQLVQANNCTDTKPESCECIFLIPRKYFFIGFRRKTMRDLKNEELEQVSGGTFGGWGGGHGKGGGYGYGGGHGKGGSGNGKGGSGNGKGGSGNGKGGSGNGKGGRW